jgi:hypothetical protein
MAAAAYGLTLDDLLKKADDLHEAGSKVMSLAAVYDDGAGLAGANYDPWQLWGGLAINDLTRPSDSLARNGDGLTGLAELVAKLSGNCMKLFTWINPSYVWIGSKVYTDDPGPASPSASKFAWMDNGQADSQGNSCSSRVDCTISADVYDPNPYAHDKDGAPTQSVCPWIWDPNRNACFLSVWGNQPSGDWSQQAWRDYVTDAMKTWVDRGVDGFILDDPTKYINIGEDGPLLNSRLIAPVQQHSPRAVILGEEYVHFSWVGLPMSQQLDGSLMSEKSSSWMLYDAIANQDWTQVEPTFFGADVAANQCSLAPAGDGENCPKSWQRLVPRAEDAWGPGNALARAVSAAAGYLTATESSTKDFYFPYPYPGEKETESVSFISWLSSPGTTWGAFSPYALRAPSYNNGQLGNNALYGMVKYDAFGSGLVAIFVAHLGDGQGAAQYDLASSFSPQVYSWVGGDQAQVEQTMPVNKFSFAWQAMPNPLPHPWYQIGEKGKTNCYDGSGVNVQFEYNGDNSMTLGACLLSCLGTADFDCASVSVQWNSGDFDGGNNNDGANLVQCWGHGPGAQDHCHQEEGWTSLKYDK